jgi:hypothetical protein
VECYFLFLQVSFYKIYSFLLIGCFYENDVCNVKRAKCEDYTEADEQTLCESENNRISTGLALRFYLKMFFHIFIYIYLF